MDFKAVQIVSIEKHENKSKYILNENALLSILNTIGEKELSIISIAGPSRQGKSFILSFIAKYLSNQLEQIENDWCEDKNEQLFGFKWKCGIDLITKGIWISMPFILKKQDGKQLAVILMDTQGVFDQYSTQRDWFTIVGLSLLSSSCLIFNVFNNIQEDVLKNLESFLEYGLLATNTESKSESRKAFQNLVFLIRDWNLPFQFKHGLFGGQEFLNRKLELNESPEHSSSNNSRILITKCFENISCFLMPDPGQRAKEEEDFKGSIAELSDRFTEYLNKLFSHLFNSENLVPKTIDEKPIIGSDLFQFMKEYVKIFNSDKIPSPSDLVEATKKASDLIFVNKMKERYNYEMNTVLNSKPFFTRSLLNLINDERMEKILENFTELKKSSNKEIMEELISSLKECLINSFAQVNAENQIRREKIANYEVEKCYSQFKNQMKISLDTKFFKPQVLNGMLQEEKFKVLKVFEDFTSEEKDVFASFQTKVFVFQRVI